MKIPKSIAPDRIKDAIVEINFESDYPNEVNLGVFFSALKDNYKYTNKPIGTQQVSSNSINFNKEFTLSLGGISLFYNDKIKFQINNNSIAFNCLGDYILWDNYFNEIKNVLTKIASTNVVKAFKRVGVRYISEYKNIDLKDSINFNFSFGFPDVVSNSYSFNSEFDLDEHKVVLNLNNNVLIVIDEKVTPTSVIDIDIIKMNLNVNNHLELFKIIDDAHTLEKNVFFKLIREEFLESLNPKY